MALKCTKLYRLCSSIGPSCLYKSFHLSSVHLLTNYYEILGVDKNASMKEIKKAYIQLAKLHHPDSNLVNPDSLQTFQKIKHAYEFLSNDTKRWEWHRQHFPSANVYESQDFDMSERFAYQGGTPKYYQRREIGERVKEKRKESPNYTRRKYAFFGLTSVKFPPVQTEDTTSFESLQKVTFPEDKSIYFTYKFVAFGHRFRGIFVIEKLWKLIFSMYTVFVLYVFAVKFAKNKVFVENVDDFDPGDVLDDD